MSAKSLNTLPILLSVVACILNTIVQYMVQDANEYRQQWSWKWACERGSGARRQTARHLGGARGLRARSR